MSIEAYRAGFLPVIERKTMEAELTLNQNILNDVICPTTEVAASMLPKGNIKSDQLKRLEASFTRMLGGSKGMLEQINDKSKQLVQNITIIESLVKKEFGSRVASETLTYKQIALIRSVEVVSHFTDYVQSFLFYCFSAENAKRSGERLDQLVNKATIRKVEEGFVGFCQILKQLIVPNKDLETRLVRTPDIVVKESDENVASSIHGSANINPTEHGFISTKYNVIFRVRMAWADYQARRYHVARELLKAYEVQLAYLKQTEQTGDANPVLEKRIEELTALIEEQRFKIAKMEERYA